MSTLTPSSLPRILFVTAHAFNQQTGGGVTFSNLFRGWPKDRLATVHCDTVPVTTDVCERYFALTSQELRKWGPLHRLGGGDGAVAAGGEGTGRAATPTGRQLLQLAKRRMIGDYSPETATLTPALERWIEEFRPQVLYTILGTNGLMTLIDRIRARFRLPLVVHFMDDWPSAIYRGGLWSPVERRRMWRHLRGLVGAASARLAISPAMADAFEQVYGVGFRTFLNTVDVARLDAIAAAVPRDGTASRLLYAGNILPFAQLDSLLDCCRAVQALADQGRDIRLDIYCPADCVERLGDRLRVGPAIHLHRSLTDWDAYYAEVCKADLLLLPANFDAASVRYIRYSLPTKVPEYLASGTPVLVYGPAATAQVAYARDHGWGHVVDRPGVVGLGAAIAGLLDDPARRHRLAEVARAVTRRNHDAQAVRAAFRQVMVDAAELPNRAAA